MIFSPHLPTIQASAEASAYSLRHEGGARRDGRNVGNTAYTFTVPTPLIQPLKEISNYFLFCCSL
jgi:hypothetical protein